MVASVFGLLVHSRQTQMEMNNMNLIENLVAKRSPHSVDEIEMTKLHCALCARDEDSGIMQSMHDGFGVERTPK